MVMNKITEITWQINTFNGSNSFLEYSTSNLFLEYIETSLLKKKKILHKQ